MKWFLIFVWRSTPNDCASFLMISVPCIPAYLCFCWAVLQDTTLQDFEYCKYITYWCSSTCDALIIYLSVTFVLDHNVFTQIASTALASVRNANILFDGHQNLIRSSNRPGRVFVLYTDTECSLVPACTPWLLPSMHSTATFGSGCFTLSASYFVLNGLLTINSKFHGMFMAV